MAEVIVFDSITGSLPGASTPITLNDYISFTPTVSGQLNLVKLNLINLNEGSPNSFSVGLYDNVNTPNPNPGPLIVNLANIDDNTIPTSLTTITIQPTNVSVSAGTRYWVGLTTSTGSSVGIFLTSNISGPGVSNEWTSAAGLTVFNGTGNIAFMMIAGVSGSTPCLHPQSRVMTAKGFRRICNIKKEDQVYDYNGKPVEVVFNMQFPGSHDFILIAKDALGESSPSQDLYIRKGHPILYKGSPVDPAKLLGKVKGVYKAKFPDVTDVWSLCTKERTFVNVQGVYVATWAYDDVMSDKFRYKYNKF